MTALVALDFDGTLAPISPHPDDARPLPGAEQVLREVRATGATLAIVSGRSVASLLRVSGFGGVPGIIIYGTHGVERWHEGSLRAPPAPPGLAELRVSLPGLLSLDPDLWIEEKELSLVVHARLTADPVRVLEKLRAPVEKAAAAAGLGVRPGKEVLEICIPGIDKGTALRELIRADTTSVFYAGDDVGDLPAIAEVKAWAARTGRPALTVGVGPGRPACPSAGQAAAVGAGGNGPLVGRTSAEGADRPNGPLVGRTDVTVPDPASLLSLLRQFIEDDLDSCLQGVVRSGIST